MSSFFSDPGVITDLLSVCRAEGLLTARVEKKVRILLEQGLHPEQVLLGTRLLSVQQYGEVLQQVFGVPFVRMVGSVTTSSSLLPRTLLFGSRAVLVEHTPERALVAFADPSSQADVQAIADALRTRGVALRSAVTLWSDVRRGESVAPSSHSVGTLRRTLHAAWRRAGMHSVQLAHAPDRALSVHAEGREPLASRAAAIPSSHLSALALQMERLCEALNITLESRRLSHGVVVSCQFQEGSSEENHPFTWPQAVRAFLRAPQGVLACVGADASARTFFARCAEKNVVVSDVEEMGEEEVFHAALMGRPLVVLSPRPLTWLSDLASIGVPVHLLERHLVPAGMSYTSRPV